MEKNNIFNFLFHLGTVRYRIIPTRPKIILGIHTDKIGLLNVFASAKALESMKAITNKNAIKNPNAICTPIPCLDFFEETIMPMKVKIITEKGDIILIYFSILYISTSAILLRTVGQYDCSIRSSLKSPQPFLIFKING